MANKTILDFPSATTPLSATDILYIIQGSGTTRDKQGTILNLQNIIGDALIEPTVTGSIDLSTYSTNVVARADPSGNITLTFTGALPAGKQLLIINVSSNIVTNSIEGESIDLIENQNKSWLSDGTNMIRKKDLSNGIIGEIKQYDKTFPNTPALTDEWAECDGSVISDSDSPYNTYRTRNLNGGSVVFSTTWAAGVATVAATDVTGLGVGDFVSGAGIAAEAYITDITGTTVTMSDTSFSGAISTTYTNDGRFIRGNNISGNSQADAFQGWQLGGILSSSDRYGKLTGDGFRTTGTTSPGDNIIDFNNTFQGDAAMAKAKNDGTNGEPRTSSETRPINTGVVYIMRIK